MEQVSYFALGLTIFSFTMSLVPQGGGFQPLGRGGGGDRRGRSLSKIVLKLKKRLKWSKPRKRVQVGK